ncbi:MAG: phage holin family protein [Oscillospiraceae bacterium]|nr:phage holin family protein [Oscillospiraceae bacterium]
MEHNVKAFKAALSAAMGVLTALWGWFGWLMVAWVLCMALDIATGMAAALREGKWASRVARDGLWHKAGCVAAVTAAGLLDLVVGLLLQSLPAGALPFEYTVLLCPLTTVWYLLTEVGSILENAGAMGAPIPAWLRKAIAALRDRLEDRA